MGLVVKMETDQPLPHDDKAEAALLGSLFVDQKLIYKINRNLQPADFHNQAYQTIFQTIKIFVQTETFNTDEFSTFFMATQPNFPLEVLMEVMNYSTSVNWQKHFKIVTHLSRARKFIQISYNAFKAGFSPADGLIEDFMSQLSQLTTKSLKPHQIALIDQMREKEIEAIRSGEIADGLLTGIHCLDEYIRLQKEKLIVIAARPSIGKTAFALNLAANLCVKNNSRGAFFSLETSSETIDDRLVSMLSEVSIENYKKNQTTAPENFQIQQARKTIRSMSLEVFAQGGITPEGIFLQAYEQHLLKPLDFIIIDYCQIIKPDSRGWSKEDNIANIVIAIKKIGERLQIPVILLAQLNRQAEGSTPKLSHLRDSAALEHDADIVLLLDRERDFEGPICPALCIVAKNKEGKTGIAHLGYKPECTLFKDAAELGRDETVKSIQEQEKAQHSKREAAKG